MTLVHLAIELNNIPLEQVFPGLYQVQFLL